MKKKLISLLCILLLSSLFIFADKNGLNIIREFDTEQYVVIDISSVFNNINNDNASITIKTSVPFKEIFQTEQELEKIFSNTVMVQSCEYDEKTMKSFTCNISGINGNFGMGNCKLMFDKLLIARMKNKSVKIDYSLSTGETGSYKADLSTNIDYAKAIQKADITVEDLDGNGTSNKNNGGKNGVGTNDKLIPNSSKNTSGSNSSGNGNNNTSGNSNSNTDGKNNSGNSDDKDNDSDKNNKEVLTDDDRGSWFL